MTERRPGKDRNAEQVAQHAGAPRHPASDVEALLGLHELAGNRAVADLLAGAQAGGPAPSAGIRVRDRLRGTRSPEPSTLQRLPPDEKEVAADKGAWDAKAAYSEKEVAADKGAWDAKAAYSEKDVGQKAWEKGGAGEKGIGPVGTTPTLAVGSAGPSVARLQGLLVEAGFVITPDGSFGPRTRAAVVTFQTGRGLAPDGIVGPMTWGALQTPGTPAVTAAPGGLATPGEIELAGPGAGMEKEGPAGPGAGEATLPDEAALKKKEGEAWGSKGNFG